MHISRIFILITHFFALAIMAKPNSFALAQEMDFKNPPSSTIVGKGESLFDIAERTHSPLSGLIKFNKLEPPFALNEGQELKLPPLKVHIVKSGETFEQIAKRYSVHLPSLANFNNLPKPYKVSKGQKIILPPMVRDNLTGLEPRDLIDLLTAEIDGGAQVTGKTPEIILTPKPEKSEVPELPPIITGPSKLAKGQFIWPLNGKIIDKYGQKPGFRKNDGIDIAAPEDTPFVAAADGEVVYAGNQLVGYGWLVLVRHSNKIITAYAYGSNIKVKEKDKVKKGQILGLVGQTGRAKTPSLHFQIRDGTTPVDPTPYLPQRKS